MTKKVNISIGNTKQRPYLYDMELKTMSNNKQSSVEILCQKLANKLGLSAITFYIDHQEEIAEAKAMHKEEIEKAYLKGYEDKDFSYFDPKQYYNETYGGNK